jgi:WD40 repeat protein
LILNSHTSVVWSIVTLDNQSFASASQDGTIKLWLINSKLSFSMLKDVNYLNPLYSLALLKNGQLVSAGFGAEISIWQKETFELIKVLKEHTNSVTGLAVFENGNFISVSADHTIIIWDCNSLIKLESFITKELTRSVALLPNYLFMTGTQQGTISI